MQHSKFLIGSNCTEDDGPLCMSKEKRLETRDKKVLPETVTQDKGYKEVCTNLIALGVLDTNQKPKKKNFTVLQEKIMCQPQLLSAMSFLRGNSQELHDNLSKAGYVFVRRNYPKQHLQQIAQARSIETHKQQVKIVPGWAGKPKGMIQLLQETGWRDPPVPLSKYRKLAKKDELEDNGEIKDEVKPFILLYLSMTWPDFADKLSDMEHLVSELSTNRCTINLLYTPRYHSEIAGKGVENGWGSQRRLTKSKT